MVQSDEERFKPIKQKVQSISNLSNTMDTFIANLIEEIDESRSQMFDILENIAFYEARSDIKTFNKQMGPQKSKKQAKASIPRRQRLNKEACQSMSDLSRSLSGSSHGGRVFDDINKIGRIFSNDNMAFESNDEQNLDDQLLLDSPKGSVRSHGSFIQFDQSLLDEMEDV